MSELFARRADRYYDSVAEFQDQNYLDNGGRPTIRGYAQAEFEMSLHNLRKKYCQLSAEDVETINKIAKKVC